MDWAETQEQTAESLGFSDILQDCLECGILLSSATGHVQGFNADIEQLINLKPDAILGQTIACLPPALSSIIQETLDSQAAVADRPIQIAGEAGQNSGLHARTIFYRTLAGQPGGVVVIVHDYGAASKLGASMQRLDRLASIGTLSASMAHEIKNALVAVNTFVEDLLQRNKDADLAALVSRELRRIDSIVSQMLKFAGPAKPTFLRVRLHRILDQSLRLIQSQLEAKQIRLRRSFSAPSDLVEGDDYQLEQAFINLLLNAVASMGTGGQLGMTTEVATPPPAGSDGGESVLQVTISDTGIGIPPENLSRLFEPFFTTKTQGTGLGLAITRRIILEHRGKITVESELSKGTTFRIFLPLAKRAP